MLKLRNLKVLNVVDPFNINRVDCPSLEKFVCFINMDLINND